MTLPEFLGTLGGFILGLSASVAALVLGYGGLVAALVFPVGLLAGWVLGVATTSTVDRLAAKAHRREIAAKRDDRDSDHS